MAAQQLNVSSLQAAVEHNSTVLEIILRTVQDLQGESLKTNRRLLGLEAKVTGLLDRTSSLPGTPTPGPQTPGTPTPGPQTPSTESSAKEEILAEIREQSKEIQSFLEQRVNDAETAVTSEITETKRVLSSRIKNLSKSVQANNRRNNNSNSKIGRLIRTAAFTNTNINQKFGKLQETLNEATGRVNELCDTGKKNLAIVERMKKDFETEGRVLDLLRADSRAVIDQIVTEGQITREVVMGERETRLMYTCDFYVTQFSDWVGSGEGQYSRLWYVDQVETYLKGHVRFHNDKKMDVWLVNGRYPHVVGLAGRTGVRDVRVSVAVVGQTETGDNWELGSFEFNPDEMFIPVECDGWVGPGGCHVASGVSHEELYSRGLVTCDRILLRYTITVL
ncbi:uncharacterized protein LOC101858168 [Aplysia californica]|uniref:Uncharacterized protein LOC101858168 n=1 Tax=Aplysia californica TaxID=6500 RepID=A0ABM0JHR8_APLCA|nr:uncharacterized protein LOC101858168 [Aplysia californica]